MRKLIIIAFLLFIGISSANAQVTISPGIRGGLNLSRLTNIDYNNTKSDFYIGGLVDIKFNKYFSLQPELTYSRQGSQGREYNNDNGSYRNVNFDLNYITVGAVAKLNFRGSGFHILAGPTFDFKTDDNFINYEEPVDFDLGIVGGIGYTLPNGLTFEARIKQGFIDIYGYDGLDYDDGDYDDYSDDFILNQVFQIGISYTFKTR